MNPRIRTTLLALALGGSLSAVARAQEPEVPPVEPETPSEDDAPPTRDEMNPFRQGQPGAQDPRAELEELFAKVEKRLLRVGSLLVDASAGDTSGVEQIGSAGIDELIREAEERPRAQRTGAVSDLLSASRSQGERLLDDIDQILELAQQQGNGT